MIRWGQERLNDASADIIEVTGISVGSLRYAKAGLILLLRNEERARAERVREGWPSAALRSLDERAEAARKLSDGIRYEPSNVLWEVLPREKKDELTSVHLKEWDVFISHASEDKPFVRSLADALTARGLKVWFDEFTLTVGDSLRRSIDEGLARSRFGIVVISRKFLEKEWPQRELDGLTAREVGGVKVILPVWHEIPAAEVRAYSPTLSDRVATSSMKSLDRVVADLLEAVERG